MSNDIKIIYLTKLFILQGKYKKSKKCDIYVSTASQFLKQKWLDVIIVEIEECVEKSIAHKIFLYKHKNRE